AVASQGASGMGFTVYYRTTQPITPALAKEIQQAASDLCQGRTWLSCEPVAFFSDTTDQLEVLEGGSKPNFLPHPDDVASAKSEQQPHESLHDMIEDLCRLSRDHDVDSEIGHDYGDGPVSQIRGGECDTQVIAQIEAFDEMAKELGE